jgi:crotonobetainyl-CoA:carnitine CoA-transferase CaiB-like acyl-CoA transferase
VCAALFHREKTGRGQRIDIPMFETMLSHLLSDHIAGQTFDPPNGPVGYPRLLAPERRPYKTSNGYVCAVIYTNKQWESFFAAIDRLTIFQNDPRFVDLNTRTQHINALQGMAATIFLERSTEEWLALLTQADVPCMPLHTLETIFDDPHLKEVGLFKWDDHPTEGRVRRVDVPTQWSDSQPVVGRPAPQFGQHSREVLSELGYSDAEIASLIEQGATVCAKAP